MSSVADPGIAGGGYYQGRRWRDRRSRARRGRREAPERRGGWGPARGAVAPHQYGGLGAMPPEKFQKINVEITYFSACLQAEMVYSAVASRQDYTIGTTKWSNKNATHCIIAITLPHVNQFS